MIEHRTEPHPDAAPGYERRDANVLKLTLTGIISALILIGMLVGLNEFFRTAQEELHYEVALKPQSSTLRSLRAKEMEALTTYGVVDSARGLYRIPIERAMQLLAAEGK
ncbi:MAG: hypothetical protein FJY67_02600 [Calditrichaeota bacterium]|nr:hypothetical protein [Calditrichota bacterium]